MAARFFALFLLLALLLPAAKKTVGTARGENEDLILTVTLYIDAAGVKETIGDVNATSYHPSNPSGRNYHCVAGRDFRQIIRVTVLRQSVGRKIDGTELDTTER